MAITLEQTGRTEYSVTFKVSGITDDRRTYIWIPSIQKWRTLQDAESEGRIIGFYTNGGDNGYIQVIFNPSTAAECKVYDFYVANMINGSVANISDVLHAVLRFAWRGSPTKYIGNNIDITANDFANLNWFALYIYYWIGGVDNSFEFYNDIIHAQDFIAIAQKIYNTALGLSSARLPNRSTILNNTRVILDGVVSGATLKASYFNNIKDAINMFNLKTL